MARTKFVAGNWKMYTDRDRARELATAVASRCEGTSVEVAVCPPFPWLMAVKECFDRQPSETWRAGLPL